MAEVKNSFLSSKMNKDLDDRLIPNSEYRDALNIEVGKSETNNIGVLQNVYGNVEIPKETIPNLECIGIFMDNQNNRIYQFLTNYTDPSPSQITLCETSIFQPMDGWVMKITVYDLNTLTYSTLVEGTFLNFSKTNLVIGVNLVEGLLFWSDNRNQPRKINYNNAINNPTYYTTETQISVAKYAPVEPISLVRKATATVVSVSGNTYVLTSINGAITVGMTVVSQTVSGSEYLYVMSVEDDTITLYDNAIAPDINPGDDLIFLTSTMTNKSDDPQWPGDPSFLEDKYVRFSYRFKFDDNEYSLMAPFTQIAYIPRQKGYFINGDETAAYRSTIVKWMENNVNNIELLIPLPDKGSTLNDTYKITNVEILYKESDALAVKVIDSIPSIAIKNIIPNTNIYTYSYQSQKPYKTLSESQTTRVYDIVPTRAIGQEIAGNRVIYANFYTMYTPPANINYNTAVQPKSDKFTTFVEYPNHTLKQNRNYQVGFILADKFGRQSSVLLSSVDLTTTTSGSINFGGSTVYAPYQSETGAFPDVRDWFGNALLVLVNDPISSQRNIPAGTPGLYAEPTSPNGFAIVASSISGNFYTFTLDTLVTGSVKPITGNYLRGALTDYVKVLSINPTGSANEWIVETTGPVNNLYLPAVPVPPVDAKFAYTLNQIGWYSYKVVVKQQQQDYYNVYLPGMLDGYPSGQTFGSQVVYTGALAEPKLENSINTTSFPVGETGKTSHIVLINDNINKVPRDLNEVGPDQKQYRSSVQLFGRVENTAAQEQLIGEVPYDNQYTTTITYLLSTNPTALNNIKAGDGIQSNEAKASIPNPDYPGTPPDSPPITIDNPDAWYANTVVVSNELYNYTAELSTNAAPGTTITLTLTTFPLVSIGDTFTYTVGGINYNNTVLGISGAVISVNAFPVTITTATILYFTNPTKGLITFSPPNWTRSQSSVSPSPGAYINFTVTKAENIQYFPARKADVVSSIASATDFNFLDNTVDNIKGTAGLNFYQLQTRPLIGRVSTTKSIGVTSEFMVPFLSVYETAPEVSALALFWETASTGLISDLNYDVANGFNGPTGFSDLGFSFFEFQDPDGIGETTGSQNSKYITDPFNVLNSTGFPLTPDVPLTFSYVYTDASPADISDKFDIVEFPIGDGTWRFIIKDTFVFDHNAPSDSKFTFKIKVVYGGVDYTITYIGRLSNNAPFFIEDATFYNKTIDQTIGFIETITAENGSLRTPQIPPSGGDNQTDLYWDILSGNAGGYFQIVSTTGALSLINSSVPLGIYTLTVRVRDAFLASPPTELSNDNPDYATKSDTITFNITIGPKPVNSFLQRYDTGPFIWNQPEGTECVILPGQGYGAVYVGKSNLDVNPYSTLPSLLNTTPAPAVNIYQDYVNVQVENGAEFPANPPQGLTQGELEFTITTFGLGNIDEIRRSDVNFILYFREPVAPNNTWQSILDNNNVGSPNSASVPWQNGVGDHLGITINTSDLAATRSTSLVISNPTGVAVGEYCLIVWHDYFARVDGPDPGPLSCGDSFYTSVQVKDANYDYAVPLPPQPPTPLAVVPIKYSVQLQRPSVGDYPSAIPYSTQDASIGFPFQTSAVVDVNALAGQNTIKITAPNSQIVPGIWIGSDRVSDIQIDGVTIILSANLTTQIDAGETIYFNTFNYPGQVLSGYTGEVWASTNNPLHVRQFYIDSTLTTLWNPPLADAFYLFYNTDRDFDNPLNVPVPGMGVPTNKPICCAEISATGQVTPQTAPVNTIQTAWKITPGALANYGRNIYQFTEIP